MVIKNKIYISGPRMGTNNFMYGVELKDINKKKPSKSKKKKGK
jgi:hypothetical protein